ncbi:hypothetical protein TEQG_04143 [Trichophyton equinum CBS 127.97]|uniref:Uncharacterized protein n=1 Tax=Trichophyton equinum (strain ATCC MYA-4606 / CBS 127.97) TaxID=559882 RepID=F2PTA7_TRIEC|nr:hypothetical protein TEQG_04143 [Trichophyton equinum CBS 127.97]
MKRAAGQGRKKVGNIQDDDKTTTRRRQDEDDKTRTRRGRQDEDKTRTTRRTGRQESDESRARLSYLAAGSKSKSLSSASALIKRKGPLRRTYAHHCGTEDGVPSPTCVVRWPVGWIESAQGGLTSRFSPFVRIMVIK